MSLYGYIRVSSRDQNEDRQIMALSQFPIPEKNIYIDKKSGKDFNRPAYRRLLRRLKPGDLLYVKSIDRLGRNYTEIIEQWRIITREKNADIKIIDMPLLDTTYGKDLLGTFISDLVLSVLSYAAELERDHIRSRQAEGIAAAKARGVRFGRPVKNLPDNFDELYTAWRRGELSSADLEKECDMALGVIYRKIRARQQSSGMNAALPPVRKYRRGRFIKAAPRPPAVPPVIPPESGVTKPEALE